MLKTLLLVALGGGIGSVFRYVTTLVTAKFFSGSFPLATFITNMAGCFLIGILAGYFEKNSGLSPDLKFLLITGFCGGYTTFSAFGLENIRLMQEQQFFLALLYTALSVVLGLLCVGLGLLCTK